MRVCNFRLLAEALNRTRICARRDSSPRCRSLRSSRLREAFTAARAPGSITPITGTMVSDAIASSATALEVLHATTSILIPLASRNSVFSLE